MAFPEDAAYTPGAVEDDPARGAVPKTAASSAGVLDRTWRPVTDYWVREGLRGILVRRPDVRMVPDSTRLDGLVTHFAVSDNEDAHGPAGPGSPPIWAVNLHGYFAAGPMYWRESARLAERLGWRVVNPSLPGFGGSDPLPPGDVSLRNIARHVQELLRRLGAGPVVLLGHSMGGAVAMQLAIDHPGQVLGVIYRAGVATPAWRHRHGVVARALTPFLPEVAPLADMANALLLDIPDLFVGRVASTMRSLIPDVRRNVANVARTFPLGNLLMSIDLRPEIRQLHWSGMPIWPVWGCFDRVVTPDAAREISDCCRTPVQWVPGGHSWMLARPQGQGDLLQHVAAGQRFLAEIEARWWQMVRRGPATQTA